MSELYPPENSDCEILLNPEDRNKPVEGIEPQPNEEPEKVTTEKPKKTRKDYNRAYYEKTREKQLTQARERYQAVKDEKNKKKKERYHNNLEESRAYYREYTRQRRARLREIKEAEH